MAESVYITALGKFLPGPPVSNDEDETIALYVARILNESHHLGLLNNKHPIVPLSTLAAGFRLMLHGLAAETLHATLREQKRSSLR